MMGAQINKEATGKRVRITDKHGDRYYLIITHDEIFASSRDNPLEDSLMDLVCRLISKLRQHGGSWDLVKDQLRKSSHRKGDIPDVLYRAIIKTEKEDKNENH